MGDEALRERARWTKETLDRLKIALQKNRLVVVVGAGVTLAATADASGQPIPRLTWKGLIRNGLDYLVQEGYESSANRRVQAGLDALESPDSHSLLDAASLMADMMRQHKQLPTWLESVFRNLTVTDSSVLTQLKSLHDRGAIILTTNYDGLLEEFCRLPRLGRSNKDEILRFKRGDLDAILHVHGSYHDADEVVLDGIGYYKVQQSDEIQSILQNYLGFNTVLFIGCGSGLEDPNFGALLEWVGNNQQNVPNRHCVLLREKDKSVHRSLVSLRYGASYADLAPFLTQLLEPLPSSLPQVISRLTYRPYSSIPETRMVNHFHGRKAQLQAITDFFLIDPSQRQRALILQAMGGQGKTQIALKYCHQSKEVYRDIFWIYAASEAVVLRSYQNIAESLLGTSVTTQEPEAVVQDVKSVLEKWSGRWLIVFDNYDDPINFPTIEKFIPSGKSGDVLFTTRNGWTAPLGSIMKISPMSLEEGADLLLHKYSEVDVEPHRSTARQIVKRFGGLALAIDQAVAYIVYKEIPVHDLDKFLKKFEEQRKETERVLNYTPKYFWKYGTTQVHGDEARQQALSAFTTWEMSFGQLEAEDESRHATAAHFLTLSAFLNGACISESLFRYFVEGLKQLPLLWLNIFCSTLATERCNGQAAETVQANGQISNDMTVATRLRLWEPEYFWRILATQNHDRAPDLRPRSDWQPEQFQDLVSQAQKLSLLQSVSRGSDEAGTQYSLHPLIRDWLQLRETTEKRRIYAREACHFVVSSIKRHQKHPGTAAGRLELLAQVDTCMANDAQFNVPEKLLGHEIESCRIASWFAKYYRDCGKYHKSIGLLNLAVETRINVLGKEHPDTLCGMNDLGLSFKSQGRYEQAAEILRETLKLREELSGKEHPERLINMDNLAGILQDQGQYEQAEEIYRESLKLHKRVLGKEHPETLTSMNNLGLTLNNQGKYEQAEEIHRESVKLHEKVLGKEHPDTLNSISNLASCLWSQGRLKEAEALELKVLETTRRVLGWKHPGTLVSTYNYADTLKSLNRHEEAIALMQQTRDLRREVLGDDHPHTLDTIAWLHDRLGGDSITAEDDSEWEDCSDEQDHSDEEDHGANGNQGDEADAMLDHV